MAFLRRNDNAKPDYTGLQLQTSVSILPIPIVWGRNKLSPNVIWYANFQARPGGSGKASGGKGGAFGGGSSAAQNYTYYADLIMALCEGPIAGIGTIWKNLSIFYSPLELGLGWFDGTTPQIVWPYLAALYPYNALAYQGTAYLWGGGYNLGSSASIGNHNVEIIGVYAGTGVNGVDADPALCIYDFLTNAQYGAGFNAASINAASLFGSGGDASLQTYCKAMGIAFSPVLTSQEQGSSVLTRWLRLLSCAAVWSGGELKFIPYGDTAVSAGSPATYKRQFSVPIPLPASSGATVPAIVEVCPSNQFVSDGGVVYAFSNIPFVFIGGVFPTVGGTYGMSPSGAYLFCAADEGKPVVVTYTAAPATSYAPNLTPVYALTDLDFVDEKANKDPVQVERADVFSLPTIQRVEVSSRSNQYAATPVEARDQAQIEIFGPRVGPMISGQEICDEFVVGPIVAQTILQRELYVRTKFTFKLSWEYCLLDPMDVVTLTDANLGLSNYPVRVVKIEEDDNGLLAFTCEELVTGISNPAFYQTASPGGFAPDWAVPAVPVNTPLIFEPPVSAVTNGVQQIWLGASGIDGGGSNQWGGANVYASVDDVTYSQIGVIAAPLRQGFLTASLPAAAGWDSVDTLAVDLSESRGSLSGTSQAAAQQGATLSLVGGELLSYETATLTGANAYDLTGLARAQAGTSPAAHSSGAPFARLDGAVVKYSLPSNFLGQTVYFKFQSFNAFGNSVEDLSTCAVYAYTASAPPYDHPIAAQLQTGFALDLGDTGTAPTLADDFGFTTDPVTGRVDLGSTSAAVTHPIAIQLLSGLPLDLGLTTAFASVADDFGSTSDAVVDVIDLGTTP